MKSYPRNRLIDRAIAMGAAPSAKQVDLLESMQMLIQRNHEVQSRLDEACKHTNDANLASFMKRLAQSRRTFASDLQAKITSERSTPARATAASKTPVRAPRLTHILRAIQAEHHELLNAYQDAVRQGDDLTNQLLLMHYEELAEDDAKLVDLCAHTKE